MRAYAPGGTGTAPADSPAGGENGRRHHIHAVVLEGEIHRRGARQLQIAHRIHPSTGDVGEPAHIRDGLGDFPDGQLQDLIRLRELHGVVAEPAVAFAADAGKVALA
jgi:hypothetical protein